MGLTGCLGLRGFLIYDLRPRVRAAAERTTQSPVPDVVIRCWSSGARDQTSSGGQSGPRVDMDESASGLFTNSIALATWARGKAMGLVLRWPLAIRLFSKNREPRLAGVEKRVKASGPWTWGSEFGASCHRANLAPLLVIDFPQSPGVKLAAVGLAVEVGHPCVRVEGSSPVCAVRTVIEPGHQQVVVAPWLCTNIHPDI